MKTSDSYRFIRYLRTPGCRAWWARWSSAFVATVCGIVITLGTNAWIQSRAKEAKSRRAVEVTMLALHEDLVSMRSLLAGCCATDSLYHLVTGQMAGDTLNEHTAQEFFKAMSETNFQEPWRTASGVYNSSFDFWLAIDDPGGLQALGLAFGNRDLFSDVFTSMTADRRGIFLSFTENSWKDEYADCATMMRQWLATPRLKRHIAEHGVQLQMLQAVVNEQHHLLEYLRDRLDISVERLLELRTEYQLQTDMHFSDDDE